MALDIGGVNRFVPVLVNNNKYVFHYKKLQLYLSLELKLTKVNRIWKYKICLKKYIDFDTDKRKKCCY